MAETWVKEHAGQIIAGLVIVAVLMLMVAPMISLSGMADLCVRRPMCVHECCPMSGFKSSRGIAAIKKKLGV